MTEQPGVAKANINPEDAARIKEELGMTTPPPHQSAPVSHPPSDLQSKHLASAEEHMPIHLRPNNQSQPTSILESTEEEKFGAMTIKDLMEDLDLKLIKRPVLKSDLEQELRKILIYYKEQADAQPLDGEYEEYGVEEMFIRPYSPLSVHVGKRQGLVTLIQKNSSEKMYIEIVMDDSNSRMVDMCYGALYSDGDNEVQAEVILGTGGVIGCVRFGHWVTEGDNKGYVQFDPNKWAMFEYYIQ